MHEQIKLSNRELLPLYAVIFFGFFGYALTVTLFIPMLLDRGFAILPASSSVSLRASLSGLLLAMYPVGQFLGSPIIGKLSDHFGRKKVLLISLVLSAFGFLCIGLSIVLQQLVLLFISCFFTGLCESNMAIAQSVIADTCKEPVRKSKLMGYVYAACSLGYTFGPLVGGFLAGSGNYSMPFLITALAIMGLILWIKFRLTEHYKPNEGSEINIWGALTAFKTIFEDRHLLKIYFINFLIFFSVMGIFRMVPLYVVDKWNPSLYSYSLLISYVSFLCFLTCIFLTDHLTRRFAIKKLLSVLLVLGGIAVLLIIIPHRFSWIWLTFGLAVVPMMLALGICTTWLSHQAPPGKQGQVLGNNQALLVLGEAVSAAVGGLLAAMWIPLPVIVIGAIFVLTGFMVRISRTSSY